MTSAPRQAVDVLTSPVRRQIVDLLASLPDDALATGLSAAEIGERMAIHPTTARFHLDQLEANALVESHFVKAGVGRPRKLYRTPTRPLPLDGGAAMQKLTRLLTETWPEAGSPALTPEQAGHRWALRHVAASRDGTEEQARTPGTWLGKVGLAVDGLHDWGYQPDLRTEDQGRTVELVLAGCPFMGLAKDRPEVVCGVHRGLIRGALEALGEPDAEVALHPFVEPRVCHARISTRADFGDRNGAGPGAT